MYARTQEGLSWDKQFIEAETHSSHASSRPGGRLKESEIRETPAEWILMPVESGASIDLGKDHGDRSRDPRYEAQIA